VPRLSDITVVVPTRNEAANVTGFLRSLPAEVALIVVDNSSDATREIIVATRPDRTRVLFFGGTLTEARQLGALSASTPWLLFTDADVVFADDYFERLNAITDAEVVYGRKLSRDRYRSYYHWFARGQGFLHALGWPCASGSNLLVAVSAFQRVGGFDVDLKCNEDSELVWRLHDQGFSCAFEPRLIAWAADHRRLDRGAFAKTMHTLARCVLLRTGLMPRRWRAADWGYWRPRPGEEPGASSAARPSGTP
jgi:glycosyltransferase involved in cell wall biosynthesis